MATHSGRLEGKVALITGAGSGIGLAAVHKFLAEGAKVVGVDVKFTPAAEVLRSNPSVLLVTGDVSQEDQVREHCFLAVEKFGKLDIACLNAGIMHGVQSWLEMDVSLLDRVYNVNVRGPWLGIKHSVAAMLASPSKGKDCAIVLTSSVASLHSEPEFSPYNASKWAIRGLGNTAAQEFGKHGIRVNTIQPGVTKTQMYAVGDPALRAFVEGKNVLKRAAEPGEIANVMAFLASDEASYVTGSTVAVHAGQTCT
ncbi:3-oxoacyl-reductase [Gloeophyllum trabeum ATCC 11539]|uniref:3-oxoacyl-reductase n=1 Tax=Gloeophyllum trabeum (strain ATCC 11539 / FP-39264 / Madison 617) TaxID=670483 RepID=S7Q780_GLOTA|nr:3-oxoacyl-reductase [Gloeophyllum trabeum ATCC 11539]EPQ55382.1 3-oxoacyl-reductase [Gloeophyllum trabeum ATCC 11539]